MHNDSSQKYPALAAERKRAHCGREAARGGIWLDTEAGGDAWDADLVMTVREADGCLRPGLEERRWRLYDHDPGIDAAAWNLDRALAPGGGDRVTIALEGQPPFTVHVEVFGPLLELLMDFRRMCRDGAARDELLFRPIH
jgi:hypothetical protein